VTKVVNGKKHSYSSCDDVYCLFANLKKSLLFWIHYYIIDSGKKWATQWVYSFMMIFLAETIEYDSIHWNVIPTGRCVILCTVLRIIVSLGILCQPEKTNCTFILLPQKYVPVNTEWNLTSTTTNLSLLVCRYSVLAKVVNWTTIKHVAFVTIILRRHPKEYLAVNKPCKMVNDKTLKDHVAAI
jgi:hypothetical protein